MATVRINHNESDEPHRLDLSSHELAVITSALDLLPKDAAIPIEDRHLIRRICVDVRYAAADAACKARATP